MPFWEDMQEIQDQRLAHDRSYNRITGEQNFIERMVSASALDTGLGQVAQSLMFRFENDGYKPAIVDGYNAPRDADLSGYEHRIEEFITATSPKEVEITKMMIDRNEQRRSDLENHGWARFFGNVLDPINLIPIPIAKGMGWASGFARGSVGVSAPLAVSESIRAQIDPTNPTFEPVLAVAGGALFGGAIGSIAGGMRPGALDLAGDRWFGIHSEGIDAYRNLRKNHGDLVEGLAPLVERGENQSVKDHLKSFVKKTDSESVDNYNARIDLIAEDEVIYNEFVTSAKQWNPDAFLSTGLGIEKLRISQHPFFLMKNTTFEGDFGNMWRRLADRISGPPGMVNQGVTQGVAAAQGVYNKAKLLDAHAAEASGGMYNAYLRSTGVIKEGGANVGAGGQALRSIFETATFKGKHYTEFLDVVSRTYMSGAEHSSPHIREAIGELKRYFDTMGELGVEAGVFGVRRLEKEMRFLIDKKIPRGDDFLEKVLKGNPDNPRFADGSIKKLQEKYEIFADLESQASTRGLSQDQLKFYKDLEVQIKEGELSLKDLNDYVADPARFTDEIPEGYVFENKLVEKAVARRKSVGDLSGRIAEFKNKKQLPNADEMSAAHFPRMWNQKAVRENRDELVAILRDWYGKDSGAVGRAEATIDSILKERNPMLVKRTLREGMESTGVETNANAIRSMERKVDAIYNQKRGSRTSGELRSIQAAEAKALMDEYSTDYGFGDVVNEKVSKALNDIERMAASGETEGFGAATSTFERKLDIPNAFLIRGEGRKDGIASVDFIEVNPMTAIKNYHRRMSSSIEMSNEFGDPTMKNFLDGLQDEIAALADAAPTKAKADEIMEEGARQLQAAKDLKEKVLGIYKMPEDPGSVSIRTIRAVKNFMVLALMGKASVAALADVGRGIMSVGAKNAFEGGFSRFSTGIDDFVKAGQMVNEAGGASEMALHGRFERMFDLEGYVTNQNGAEKMLESGVNKMFMLNMLMPYTDLMKRFFGSIIQSNMTKSSVAWAGKAELVRNTKNNLFHGTNLRENNLEQFVDVDGNLHLIASSNFEGKQIGVSFTDSRVSADDYAARIKGGGPEGMDPNNAIIFEINRQAIPNQIKIEAMDEKFVPMDMNAEIVIPKGEFTVHTLKGSNIEIPKELITEVGEVIIQGKRGKISPADEMALLKNGISFEDAVSIAAQFKQHGEIGNSLHLSNVGEWTDPILQKKFRTALIQEIDNAVITPGPSEKLNFMSSQIGGLMTQFKSFAFSATHRTLLAGLQQRDAKAFHGIMAMIAMGYIVDRIKSPDYDQRGLLSIDRFVQAVDYSGATGILFDMDNMLEVMSGNSVGIRPALGVDSFFKDPNLAQKTGQVGGPAASLGFDLVNSIFNPETNGSDFSRSVRRLLPFNNLIWWSGIVDQMQRSIGSNLDSKDEDE